jgi:hypothetical protein
MEGYGKTSDEIEQDQEKGSVPHQDVKQIFRYQAFHKLKKHSVEQIVHHPKEPKIEKRKDPQGDQIFSYAFILQFYTPLPIPF